MPLVHHLKLRQRVGNSFKSFDNDAATVSMFRSLTRHEVNYMGFLVQ